MKRVFSHPMITLASLGKGRLTRFRKRATPNRRSCSLGLVFTLGLATLNLSNSVQAETVKVPVGQQQAASHIAKPGKGMDMAAVKSQFGDPIKETPAKGTPPITRWEYEQFSVFFESDIVIHSVLKFQRSDR